MTIRFGNRLEGNSIPFFYNIEKDPREQDNLVAVDGWAFPHYLELIDAYMKSVDKYPNPAPVKLTEFKK